jgi:hypothetical protein
MAYEAMFATIVDLNTMQNIKQLTDRPSVYGLYKLFLICLYDKFDVMYTTCRVRFYMPLIPTAAAGL